MNRYDFQKMVNIGDTLLDNVGKFSVFQGYSKCRNMGERRGKPYLCEKCKGELRLLYDTGEDSDCSTQNGRMKLSIFKKAVFIDEELFEL